MTAAPALTFDAVTLRLGAREVLRGISLELQPGELLALAGANGSGKTTLLRVASGVLRAERGEVRVLGDPQASLSPRELARRLAVVPQDVGVPFPFRAGEVVLMGRSPHVGRVGLDSEEDVRIARTAMEKLGILELADRSMLELSGGERQLVVAARAFAQQPRVLLLDEPTAHLDLRRRIEVLAQVREFAAAGGSALVVSHDLELAARVCDRLALLAGGVVLAVGPPAEVMRPRWIREAFGIDAQVVPGPDGEPLLIPQLPPASARAGGEEIV